MNRIKDFKLHLIVLVLVIIGELIGVRNIRIGPGTAVFLPMLYALVIGMFLGPRFLKVVNEEEMNLAGPLINISVMLLMARYGALIGPSLPTIIAQGPALILQELGNLGTIVLALPLAILLGFRRESVGACFSIAREASLAIVSDIYGLDSAEGRGVMGVYITGTLLGAIYFGLLAGFVATLLPIHPWALAMACGTGSASMMAASSGALASLFTDPVLQEEILSLAAASNLLTGATGLYASLFLGIPFAEWLYRILLRGGDKK